MPPAIYQHWFLARGVETGSFTCFLGRRSKVSGRLEIWSSVRRLPASNPKQSREFHSCSGEGNRVKRIRNIDKRTCFLPFRGLRKQRKSQARPPGRSWAEQFHERATGKTATEHRIEFRDSARLEFHRGAGLESFQPPSDETCIEFSGLPREGNHSCLYIRLLFAYR